MLKKGDSAYADRHRSPSANEIYSSARVYLQSNTTEALIDSIDTTSPEKNDHTAIMRATFPDRSQHHNRENNEIPKLYASDNVKPDALASSSKAVKELKPTRLRSKSTGINEVEHAEILNPVMFERCKTVNVLSNSIDGVSEFPISSLSPPVHDSSSNSNSGERIKASPAPKDMSSVKKKLFVSNSMDMSTNLVNETMRSSIPPRHNMSNSQKSSGNTASACINSEPLSIITSAPSNIILEGVVVESRFKKPKKSEKQILTGVKRPPLSKDKIIQKAGDNSLSDSQNSDDVGIITATGPDTVHSGAKRGSRISRKLKDMGDDGFTSDSSVSKSKLNAKHLNPVKIMDSMASKSNFSDPAPSVISHTSSSPLLEKSVQNRDEISTNQSTKNSNAKDVSHTSEVKVGSNYNSETFVQIGHGALNTFYLSEESSGSLGSGSPPYRQHENDGILQQRMQEAQALNRKDIDNGAVMHKFSLWKNVNKSINTANTIQGDTSNDSSIAPDKKPVKLRGPRAILKSDNEAIDCKEEAPSSKAPMTFQQYPSSFSEKNHNVVRPTLPLNSDETDFPIHVGVSTIMKSALGASGAMATALRNMVGNAKVPMESSVTSSNFQDYDCEEFSYLNTYGSVDSLDDEEIGDDVSSMEDTDMLSRATSVDDDELSEVQDRDSRVYKDTNIERYNPKPYDIDNEFSSLDEKGDANRIVPCNDLNDQNLSNETRLNLVAAISQQGNSVNSTISTERTIRPTDENFTYVTPPRDKAKRNEANTEGTIEFEVESPAQTSERFDIEEKALAHVASDDKSVDYRISGRQKDKRNKHGTTTTSDEHEIVNKGIPKKSNGKHIPWVKGEPIGQGTFGRVYRGMNEGTGELLAVKQICLVDGAEDEVETLRGEIRLMKSLDHRNIVRYLGTSVSERYLFIILEYVPGGSIAGMLHQFGSFSEPLISRFVRQILCGVEYLHGKGILHRDIKGANVLVTDAGIAKLADFGCSKQLAGLATASLEDSLRTISGSVPWMSPEVIKQTGHGRSADIWSVGATVIEMITAKHPWPEFTNSLAALFHVATSSSPPPFPENISPILNNFLGRCLVIDPKDRGTASELLRDPFVE